MDTGYEAGVRGLRQIWRGMYRAAKKSCPDASSEGIEGKFEEYTGKMV